MSRDTYQDLSKYRLPEEEQAKFVKRLEEEAIWDISGLLDAHTEYLFSLYPAEKLKEEIDTILWQPIDWIQASKGRDILEDGKLPYYLATNFKDKLVEEVLAKVQLYTLPVRQEGFDEGVKKTMDAADSTFSAQLKQAVEAARKEERERIKIAVNKELGMLYQQFDAGKPTEDDTKATIKVYMISDERLNKFWQALKESNE